MLEKNYLNNNELVNMQIYSIVRRIEWIQFCINLCYFFSFSLQQFTYLLLSPIVCLEKCRFPTSAFPRVQSNSTVYIYVLNSIPHLIHFILRYLMQLFFISKINTKTAFLTLLLDKGERIGLIIASQINVLSR